MHYIDVLQRRSKGKLSPKYFYVVARSRRRQIELSLLSAIAGSALALIPRRQQSAPRSPAALARELGGQG